MSDKSTAGNSSSCHHRDLYLLISRPISVMSNNARQRRPRFSFDHFKTSTDIGHEKSKYGIPTTSLGLKGFKARRHFNKFVIANLTGFGHGLSVELNKFSHRTQNLRCRSFSTLHTAGQHLGD